MLFFDPVGHLHRLMGESEEDAAHQAGSERWREYKQQKELESKFESRYQHLPQHSAQELHLEMEDDQVSQLELLGMGLAHRGQMIEDFGLKLGNAATTALRIHTREFAERSAFLSQSKDQVSRPMTLEDIEQGLVQNVERAMHRNVHMHEKAQDALSKFRWSMGGHPREKADVGKSLTENDTENGLRQYAENKQVSFVKNMQLIRWGDKKQLMELRLQVDMATQAWEDFIESLGRSSEAASTG